MDAEFDDYEVSVFREVIDPKEVLLVDLHCHDRDEEDREEIWYNTETAEHLRSSLKEFLGHLDSQEVSDYRAGFSADVDGKPVFALSEEVDGQKTLIFGIEGNGTSEKLRELREEYRKEYDEVLVFSTDTHQSIHELSADNQVKEQRVRDAVEKASGSVSTASIGFTNSKAETMRLLQEDYSSLIFSINILIRLVVLMLAAVYLWLVYWVFF
jgi:putative membrane protein